MTVEIGGRKYRCPKCSEVHYVMGPLCRHIMEKHPELAELIIGDAMEIHILLGSWGEQSDFGEDRSTMRFVRLRDEKGNDVHLWMDDNFVYTGIVADIIHILKQHATQKNLELKDEWYKRI